MNQPVTPAAARGLERMAAIAAGLPFEPPCDTFYFLRHGQTECNARKVFQTPEEPLNATGLAQAERAAEVLGAHSIATIVCSDIHRAHHTAHVVAARHGLTPAGTPGLRERNFGALIGTSSEVIDWDCAPENGETLEEFVMRVRDGLEHALAHPAPVLVVAHGGTLYVLTALLGVPVVPGLLANAHPLRFDRRRDGWMATPLAAASDAGSNLA